MPAITKFTGKAVALPIQDIDTDQIIPARYLKTISKDGLAINLFNDWRYLPSGEPNPDFVINKPEHAGATILLAGDNFGCGSSREHAPWALMSYGFKAVVSTSFADIFCNNSLKNGLLTVIVDQATHRKVIELAQADANLQLTIDLENQQFVLPDGSSVEFPIDAFSKKCLLAGVDQLGYLQNQMTAVKGYESRVGDRVRSM
ncbi:MAG: 3-isopropylmalate dehydratase small subunit [Acidobacteria bacterium]|nr:3-isopropylmalate dehydratase small subunit [Acidobacteriota bacterium]MDA1234533.1 3-isopropylmalate dehydratase small subunit [Acidobacteriota bacterium]